MIKSLPAPLHSLVLSLALALLLPLSGAAQGGFVVEIDASHVRGSSDVDGFDYPKGWVLGLRLPAGDRLGIRAGYARKADDDQRTGRVCRRRGDALNACGVEEIASTTRFDVIEFGVNFTQPLTGLFSMDLGLGGTLSHITMDDVTESGHRSAVYETRTGHPGAFVSVGGRLRPFERIPLHLEVRYALHWMRLASCPGDAKGWDAFYCGDRELNELRVGLAFTGRDE